MTEATGKNDIQARVNNCIAEVLALEPSAITAESTLMNDLGAESLDLVELMFLLEQEFEIKLDKQDMSLSAQLGLAEAELHRDEVLTPRALAMLRERFPRAEASLVEGTTIKQLAFLLTAEEVAKSIARKLGESP